MPFDAPTNVTNFVTWMQYNNTVTDNMFGIGILVMLFIVVFIAFKQYETEQAFASACFISLIASIMLRVVGLVGSNVVLVFVILSAISAVLLYLKSSRQ